MPRTQVLCLFIEGMDLLILVGPFPLRIFCDSVTHKGPNPANASAPYNYRGSEISQGCIRGVSLQSL